MSNSKLGVFDFDQTISKNDTDGTIIKLLDEILGQPRKSPISLRDWTPYMEKVFQNAHSAGMRQKDLLEAIASMEPTPGFEELLKLMHDNGWDILILSDANTVFIEHWLETHGLKECITDVLTNKAYWRSDRLHIEPFTQQMVCQRCPANLCKSAALAQWLRPRPPYTQLLYVGDGRNDFCPATNVAPQATVYPRIGFPFHKLVEKTLASPKPLVKARVVPWSDGYTIMEDLFPEHYKNVKKPVSIRF